MADFQNVDVYSAVTLVDRLGIGGKDAEITFDGIRFPFVDEDGNTVIEKTFPRFLVEWLFTKQKHMVWTKPTDEQESQYVNRFAIKACPKKLREALGDAVADDSMIERDPDAIEGSDAPLYRTSPVRVVKVNVMPHETRDRHARSPMLTQAGGR